MEESAGLVVGLFLLGFVFLFFGGIGYKIGAPRGHGGTGVVLGLLLGFIGWLIVAFLPRTVEAEREYRRQVDTRER